MRQRSYLSCVLCSLLVLASAPTTRGDSEPLTKLYQRITTDLLAGQRLRVLVHVALCDNESQGIVPVKNPRICDGEVPERNIYWGTSGGLSGFAQRDRYTRVEHVVSSGREDVAIRSVWRKTFRPGAGLRARGITQAFEVEIVGLAYRGVRIGTAMRDYLRAVHGDLPPQGTEAPHVVGYIGHDYFLDVGDPRVLLQERAGDGSLEKGVFALSCLGDQYIRPAITRDNVRILALNKHLTYPGAWTVGGMIEALARGDTPKGIASQGALRFAEAMKKPHGTILRGLAYGP